VFGAGRPGDQSDGKGAEGGDSPDSGGAAGKNGKARSKVSKRVVAIGAVTAAVVAAGVTYAAIQHSAGTARPAAAKPGQPASGPIHVQSITPASRSMGVDGTDPIIVTFSAAVAVNSPRPLLTPSVAGTWSTAGNSMVFMPTAAFGPSRRVTVEVPAGPDGVRSTTGGLLATAVTEQFTTGRYAQEALAELLAQQGYLPMTWTPERNGITRAASLALAADPASLTPAGAAYDPPAGTFAWDAGYPSTLRQMWSPDQANVLLRGAVMAFESEHNMTIDGSLTPQLWKALFRAQARGEQNHNGYTYAIASKQTPETLTIWHDGRVVERTLANTGIPVSPTVDGTFPVYERFRFTIMSGTNPDGSHYSDPVSYVSYFNGGDAVHYFPRGSYGSQQSLGCVELPFTSAEQAYPYLTYGSLVTVIS
jgi:Bacterial Ig-like domain/L,D-transpeptidase catalytic domain